MEIVLKTKQSNNPQFKFLNYDDKLNPFYKELVKLIKSGRYIPRHRPHTSDSSKTDIDSNRNDTNPDEPYELKLPKVDISNTPYASLINRFKKSSGEEITSNSSEIQNVSDNTNVSSDNQKDSSVSENIFQEPNKAEQCFNVSAMTNEDFERCYQEYYRHYYSYYYMHYSSSAVSTGDVANEAWVVSESARAAATAALAAVNAVRQSQLVSSSSPSSPPAELRSIIDKMAEYVARNGDEFQHVVKSKKQDDPRFAFLQTDHIHHNYYLAKKKEFAAKFGKNEPEDVASAPASNTTKNQEVKREKSPLCSTVKNKSISFRLTKSSSSSRLKEMEETASTTAAVNDDEKPVVVAANTLHPSASYNILPGICSYTSETESEEEQRG
ncbi:unnamed protein product, partial [Hymenolepis diminuta]